MASYQQQVAAAQNPVPPPRPVRPPKPQALVDQINALQQYSNKPSTVPSSMQSPSSGQRSLMSPTSPTKPSIPVPSGATLAPSNLPPDTFARPDDGHVHRRSFRNCC